MGKALFLARQRLTFQAQPLTQGGSGNGQLILAHGRGWGGGRMAASPLSSACTPPPHNPCLSTASKESQLCPSTAGKRRPLKAAQRKRLPQV